MSATARASADGGREIRVLHLEDDLRDSELVRELLDAELAGADGLRLAYVRVDTRDAFVEALGAGGADVILSDVTLPSFDGATSYYLARELAPATPFIFVSGTPGEDAAIEALRLGAEDYVLKERIAKLPSAIRRALEQATERTRLRDAEARLQESEDRFRRFMDAAPLLAWMRDAAGRHVHVNRAFCQFLGRPESEVRGRTVEDLFPADVAATMRTCDTAVASSGRSAEAACAVSAPDGKVRHWSLVTFPLHDVSGRPLAGGVALDGTERKQLEERYLHSQKLEAVGRLAGGVAHDFNNLLTVVTGYVQMIETARSGDAVLRTYLSEIRAATERAAVLTRQLLAFSRQEVVQPVILAPNDVITGIERMVRRLVGEEVRIDIDLSPEAPLVRIDRGQLEHVVMNLVVNARDATQPGGRIVLRTSAVPRGRVPFSGEAESAAETWLLLSVADDGCGISSETRAKIFEPFFTTKGRGKGTGLGLATAHGIVNQAGGHVEVRSSLGTGSTFDVYIPAVVGAAPVPAAPPEEEPLAGGNETVLVVEDSAPVRSLVARILEQQGYRVLEAEDGVDAVGRLRSPGARVDLLVTDIVMPRMGGGGLAEAIQCIQPECRILFLSGYADHESARRIRIGPGRALLRKPFLPADLLRKARELLDG